MLVPGAGGAAWREDRHWGKALSCDGVRAALRRYASAGGASLRALCAGRGGLLEQLDALVALFAAQTSWHFFSASSCSSRPPRRVHSARRLAPPALA